MRNHDPVFVSNTIINIASVIGQTLGVMIMMKLNYFWKFYIALIPLLITIIAYPLVI